MGCNKKFLPDVNTLKELYKTLGHDEFVSTFLKYDVYIGSPESTEFIERKINKNYQFKKPK